MLLSRLCITQLRATPKLIRERANLDPDGLCQLEDPCRLSVAGPESADGGESVQLGNNGLVQPPGRGEDLATLEEELLLTISGLEHPIDALESTTVVSRRDLDVQGCSGQRGNRAQGADPGLEALQGLRGSLTAGASDEQPRERKETSGLRMELQSPGVVRDRGVGLSASRPPPGPNDEGCSIRGILHEESVQLEDRLGLTALDVEDGGPTKSDPPRSSTEAQGVIEITQGKLEESTLTEEIGSNEVELSIPTTKLDLTADLAQRIFIAIMDRR